MRVPTVTDPCDCRADVRTWHEAPRCLEVASGSTCGESAGVPRMSVSAASARPRCWPCETHSVSVSCVEVCRAWRRLPPYTPTDPRDQRGSRDEKVEPTRSPRESLQCCELVRDGHIPTGDEMQSDRASFCSTRSMTR